MTDQPVTNQPTLSPEEELDVLEAVYKIGKEKGLDLLRPEQIRRLVEAGKIKSLDYLTVHSDGGGNLTHQGVANMKSLTVGNDKNRREQLIDLMIRGLRLKIEIELKEDDVLAKMIEKLNSGQRYYLISCFFSYFYGVEDFELKNVLLG